MAITQGLILDFDGVIGDTVKAHAESRIDAFHVHQYPVDLELHELAHKQGSHPSAIIGWVLKQMGVVSNDADVETDPTVQKVVATKKELYKQKGTASFDLIPGVGSLIGWAATSYGRSNMAIATTANREHEVLPTLKKHNLGQFFKVIVAEEDTPAGRKKPDGFVYEEAARLLGHSPAELMAVEDSTNGIAASLQARVPVIGVTTTHDVKDLTSALYVATSMDEVIEYLDENSRISVGI